MRTRYAVLALCLSASTAFAQEPSAGAPAAPKPGPEHEVLKAESGDWDATVESFMPGVAQPMVSKGTETNTLLGGLWLVTNFKGTMLGQPFAGHGVYGWDASRTRACSR